MKQDLDWSPFFQYEIFLRKPWLFIGVVQVLIQDFRHGEHMNAILLEDSAHGVITSNLTAVARILKLILTNVLPYLLHSLWP